MGNPRSTTTAGNIRKNISLPQESIRKGKRLARQDKRDFSNTLACLIDAEYARRFPKRGAKSPAAVAAPLQA